MILCLKKRAKVFILFDYPKELTHFTLTRQKNYQTFFSFRINEYLCTGKCDESVALPKYIDCLI